MPRICCDFCDDNVYGQYYVNGQYYVKTTNCCGKFQIKTKDGKWICNRCYYSLIVPLGKARWVDISKLVMLFA